MNRKVLTTRTVKSFDYNEDIEIECLQLFYTEVNNLKRKHFKGVGVNKDGTYSGDVLTGLLSIQEEVYKLCIKSDRKEDIAPQEIDKIFKEIYGVMFGFDSQEEKKSEPSCEQ